MTHADYARDRRTWLAFAILLYYGFFLVSLGAFLPYLRRELDMDYTLGSLHLSAFAAGGFVTATLARRFEALHGRAALAGVGIAGLAAGALGLIAAPTPAVSLLGAAFMGATGGWTLIGVQAALADHHPAHRAVALTEANVAASAGALLLPLAVSAAAWLGSWRLVVPAAAVAGVLLLAGLKATGLTMAAVADAGDAGDRLPPRVWLGLLTLFSLICAEASATFWSASFVDDVVGLPTGTAVALTSAFYGAMLLGRLAGGALARRISAPRLLAVAIAVAAVAFPLLWLAGGAVSATGGLLALGLGMGTFWPLGVAVTMEAAPQATAGVSARTVMAGATAGALSPLLLGPLGDAVGLMAAFAIVPVSLAVAAVSLAAFVRSARRPVAVG
jgi:MFS family permease